MKVNPLALTMIKAIGGGGEFDPVSNLDAEIARIAAKHRRPWSAFHLSKSERRGKTPAELEEMRKRGWETAQSKEAGE
jgi:hypothetical protein